MERASPTTAGSKTTVVEERALCVRWIAWSLPLLLAFVVALPGNGAHRPLDTHEIFVARTAEEMLRSGEYLRPTFNGELRLEKPPLSYWLAIAAHHLVSRGADRHVSEFEARLPSVLGGLGLVLATYLLGSALAGDRRVGAVAAALVGTSAGFASYAHNARPEMVYALGCTVEVLGFVLARRRVAEGRSAIAACALAWGGFTFALLAKGPLLPAFLLLGLVLGWTLERPRVRLLRVLNPAVALLVVVPSVLLVFAGLVRAEPTALSFWWNQMFRHGGSRSLEWWLPLQAYYAWATLPLLLPWLALLPAAARDAWRAKQPLLRPLGLAVLVTTLLLSFSPMQRTYYLLPALPIVFALMAPVAVRWYDAAKNDERARARLQRVLLAHFVSFAAAGVAGAVMIVERSTHRGELVAAGALALASLGASAWLLRPRAPRALAAASAWLAGTAACALALTSWSRIGWGEDRFGDADFARAVAAAVPREVPIVSVGPSIEMIVYYGDRRVRRVARDDLRSILERDPSTRVLAVRRDLGALGVDVGEPIVARGAEDRDAVLVAARGAR